VAFLYLAHTVLSGGGHACACPTTCADSFGSVPAAEEKGSVACGESFFDTDSILTRAHENDPFLAFLSLVASLPPPLPFQPAKTVRSARPFPADARCSMMRQPHLAAPSAVRRAS